MPFQSEIKKSFIVLRIAQGKFMDCSLVSIKMVWLCVTRATPASIKSTLNGFRGHNKPRNSAYHLPSVQQWKTSYFTKSLVTINDNYVLTSQRKTINSCIVFFYQLQCSILAPLDHLKIKTVV